MTSRPFKLLICALGLGVMLTSTADAARQSKNHGSSASQDSGGCRGANLFHCGPVYNSTDYLGTDPDPFIRLQIQRDLGARYSDRDLPPRTAAPPHHDTAIGMSA
jgi:hypothetical protein